VSLSLSPRNRADHLSCGQLDVWPYIHAAATLRRRRNAAALKLGQTISLHVMLSGWESGTPSPRPSLQLVIATSELTD
jgi:hypothetical protein